MFEVGFDLVSSTMPNVTVLPTELPRQKIDRLPQPRVIRIKCSNIYDVRISCDSKVKTNQCLELA